MANKIIVPTLGRGSDWGLKRNLDSLISKWFEQIEVNESNFIHKAIIMGIKFDPEEIYCSTDGIAGVCWLADILDSGDDENIKKYHFRNFIDLIEFFKKKGYKFVDEEVVKK